MEERDLPQWTVCVADCTARASGPKYRDCDGTLDGDDSAHRAAFDLLDPTNPVEVLAFYKAYVGAGRPPEVREKMIEDHIANAGPRASAALAMMCEVAQRFAGWLGLAAGIVTSLEYVFAQIGRAHV